ncbi:ProP Permeases of the major facilitator superfamily [Microbacteriaceae bacterium]
MPYFLVELSNITSVISGSMVFIALPWLALEITGSAASAGALVALTSIPGIFFGPILGTLIDRIGRRISGFISEVLTAVTILLIPVVHNSIEISFALLVLLALGRAIVSPASSTARKSIIPDVAGPSGLSLERANSIHEAVFATGFAIGPAVAALFIGLIGPFDVFYVVAFFSTLSATALFFVRTKESRGDGVSETGSLLQDTILGAKTVLKTPAVLLGLSFVMTLAMIYLPIEMVVLPAHFNALDYAEGLGILISTMAGASVVGALLFEKLQKKFKYSTIMKFGFIGLGSSVLLMSLLPPFWVLLILGAVLGFSWGPLMPMLNTVIQRVIPENMRGRVFGIEMTIWGAGPTLTAVAVGIAVDGVGVQPVYLFLAVIVLVLSVFVSFNKSNKQLDAARDLAPAT